MLSLASCLCGLSLLASTCCGQNVNTTGSSNVTTANVGKVNGSLVALTGADVLTVGVLGDYGWTGWIPSPDHFCLEVLPLLEQDAFTIPKEVLNDCDPGDKMYITNATALQTDTAQYIGQICAMKNCSAFISVGDNFYDSGIDFTTGGILRFQEAWVDMYSQGVFEYAPWYQCLGNHDVVKGQNGVDFQTKVLPYYDDRWNFGTSGLPYYTYDLTGSDWTATFVVVDSDCFLSSYQKNTSVYQNSYTEACYQNKSVQTDFLNQTFASSNATWKFLQLHHPYISSSTNQTDLAPLISIVEAHNGIVLNGHDHCLAHYYYNNTDFILTGAAGYPQAGDCNNGTALGPFALFLAANPLTAANGFVTMDISSQFINVEYYVRDMQFDNGDLYSVHYDLAPSYSFQITKKAT
ncbi:putative tartrate-resistant acid phosphatase type 5 precursor [Exophiala viscosa]|uniref:putative tartrate-resistant acid phosphatase type 5 precursor n=1 Tax=Exophiala viscosa TaxID=2486360 RepID=UPI002197F016|nr:putative tartrate-resistant acid phosphatase type 5 precursor [Exophiala viscosa]